jgi:hypothetical protein
MLVTDKKPVGFRQAALREATHCSNSFTLTPPAEWLVFEFLTPQLVAYFLNL